MILPNTNVEDCSVNLGQNHQTIAPLDVTLLQNMFWDFSKIPGLRSDMGYEICLEDSWRTWVGKNVSLSVNMA